MASRVKSLKTVYVIVALLAAGYVIREFGAAARIGESRTDTGIAQSLPGAADVIEQAFAARQSNLFVTVEGTVERVLSDDRHEPRHQRFVIELPSGHTLLIAHNIDLAPRVANIAVGDAIRIRGEYEWNPEGGVIHWTHHDPDRRRAGGWIEHDSKRYD